MPNLNEAWKYETENFIWNINVSSSGELVAVGSWDAHIHLLDRKGTSLWKYKTGDYVASVGISRDGDVIIGASYDKFLYGLNRTGKLLFKFKADAYVRGAAISASGERIAAATWNGTVHMLDKKGEQLWKVDIGTNPLSIAVAFDGGVIVGCSDKSVRFLDAAGKEAWKFDTGSAVLSVAAAPRAGIMAAGSTDTHIYLMDQNGKLLWKYRTGGVVRGVSLSENGEYLVATSHDRYLYFFEKSGKLLWISKIAPEIWTLSTSGMCDAIAIGCRDRSVRLLENKEMVKLQLESARAVISAAEEEGADVSEPYKLLKKAETASESEKMEEALMLAGRAKTSADGILEEKLRDELNKKLAAFEKKIGEIKEARKSPARVEWAMQRARKLLEAGKLKKALESARKSDAVLEGMPAEETPKPKKPVKPPVEPETPAKPAEDKRKAQLEADLNNATAEISEIERAGADAGEAEALLEKASGAIGRGDYDVASEFIQSARKQAQSVIKHKTDASNRISEAEAAVIDAGKAGADISELSTNLKMAKDSMEAGEFELASDYANQVSTAAKDAKEKAEAAMAPGKEPAKAPAGGDSAPKCPNCGKKVKPQWKSCPFCRTRLK